MPQVVLFVSHSGQTFPTLNAARAILAECGRTRAQRRAFAASSTCDTEIAGAIRDACGQDARERLFSSGAGVRPAEASVALLVFFIILTPAPLRVWRRIPTVRCKMVCLFA